MFPVHLWSYSRAFFARDPWVQSAPGFPCALSSEEGETDANLGHHAARTRAHIPLLSDKLN